ncbi:unnamed protein product [Ascophyllum nodosum]
MCKHGAPNPARTPPPVRHTVWHEAIPMVSGAGAGMVCAVLCAPLDVAKIRMQVQDAVQSELPKKYRGITPTLVTIWKDEGIRGLYRGLTPAVVSVPVFWGIYFYAYERLKEASRRITGEDHHVLPAIAAGALTDIVTNPLWVVRTRMQTQILHMTNGTGGGAPRGMLETFRQLYFEEGLAVFYRGLTASFLGLTHVAIQFPIYERLKKAARKRRGGDRESAGELMFASASSKIVASIFTYPHEVLRARMQDERAVAHGSKKTLIGTVRTILRLEGSQALYRGFSLNLVRVVPSCMATFVTYEFLRVKLLELELSPRQGTPA